VEGLGAHDHSVRMTNGSFRRLLRELELPEAKIVMGKLVGAAGSSLSVVTKSCHTMMDGKNQSPEFSLKSPLRNAMHATHTRQATLCRTCTSAEAHSLAHQQQQGAKGGTGGRPHRSSKTNNSPPRHTCITTTTTMTTTNCSSGRQSTTLSFSCSKKPRSWTWAGK